jgi:hypothetical protein
MQANSGHCNLIVMKTPKPFPDDFDGIRNKIGEIAADVKTNKKELHDYISRPRAWTWEYWEHHRAKLTIILAALAATWYVYGLILDSHINSSIHPLNEKVNGLKSDIQGLTATVNSLQTQVATIRYSTLPAAELKGHVDELRKLKNTLAETPSNTPGYWPTSFEVIKLVSIATSPNIKFPNSESSVENSDNIHLKGPGDVLVLKGRIRNSMFEDAVIHFDPPLQLQNVTFRNCVFIIPSSQNPPNSLQEIGRTLLTSDLSKVTINAS